MLRRKWTFKCGGQQVVLVKKRNERTTHVLMKAFLWALYLPAYPDLGVEVQIGDRYKPDVVALDSQETPRFWGEAGQVGERKLQSLFKRFSHTHFAIAKWNQRLDPHLSILEKALQPLKRHAPCDLISFAEDSAQLFINEREEIQIRHEDLLWHRLT